MKYAFAISIFLGLFSCVTSKKSTNYSTKTYNIVELYSGDNGGFKENTNRVISNQKDFLKAWDTAFANYMIKETAPEVDFEKNLAPESYFSDTPFLQGSA